MASKERKIRKIEPGLRAVQPNAALESEYKRRQQKLVTSMQNSVIIFLIAAWHKEEDTLGTKISSIKSVEKVLNDLKKRWTVKFDEMAPLWAEDFVVKSSKYVDLGIELQLYDIKPIKFALTPEIKAILHAEIAQNVSLIKSIPVQYFTELEGIVMRTIESGGSVKSLTEAIVERYGITMKRAETIAHDQCKKVNTVLTRVRQLEAGITKAIWQHVANDHPRAGHIAFSGQEYDVQKGAYIDGEWIWPGQLIHCHCLSKPLLPK